MAPRLSSLLVVVCLFLPRGAFAADQWIEVKSANFAVISNAGDRPTRKLVWQLEQMRSTIALIWPWAKPDLIKPLNVIVVKDEQSMRALAPQYWEQRGGVRPASVWVTGPDRHYVVVRTDTDTTDQGTTNPYFTVYFAYVGLILDQSLDRDLPFWFRRGFTGVLANTMVRDDRILIGSPIPWQLEMLRDRPRQRIAELLQVRGDSPQLKQSLFLETYDAQTWALVHFLMFGNEGKRAPMLDAFVRLVNTGKEPAAAFLEAFGSIDAVEGPFINYITQRAYMYREVKVDLGIERGQFPIRKLSVAESSSAHALLLAAMRRPVEARAEIAEARKAEPKAADSYAAEGLLLDAEGKVEDARTAYMKAAELGTANAYVYYRLASLAWRQNPSPEILEQVDGYLSNAISRNTRYSWAYAWLGDIRSARGNDAGIGFIRRAILLDPREATHRLRAARVLLHQGKASDARVDAQHALALAEDDNERREAQSLLESIAKALAGPPR
jgi:tetratricopeptide (TPR) repeat protein